MSVGLIFILFGISMAFANIFSISMVIPLAVGLILFAAKAYDKGFSIKEILKMTIPSVKDSIIVIKILLVIGCLTGLWRICGTISYFVVKGINLLPEREFILASFLLSAIISYALGTSFGVTATCGTILIAIAKAGNANIIITAGAILSGVYVGDRGSPASSCANLVSVITKTDMRYNLKLIFKYSIIPFVLCIGIYYFLSIKYPICVTDKSILQTISKSFNLSWICIIPAAIMIVLPFCKVPIIISMAISTVVSFLIAIYVQNQKFLDVFLTMLRGYQPKEQSLYEILSGGGITSMIEVSLILLISGTYGGIFEATGMLDKVNVFLIKLKDKIGRFSVMTLLALAVCAIFCNQTIGVLMQNQLATKLFGNSQDENIKKMINIEDTVVPLAGCIPWCIACSVPLSMMSADYKSVPFAFYLYLIPVCHFLVDKIFKVEN